MNHDEIKNSISAYCLGVVDEEEKKVLDAHFDKGCSECETLRNEMQIVVANLPFSVPAQKPPPQLKEKILASIQTEEVPVKTTLKEPKPGLEKTPLLVLQKTKKRWAQVSWAFAIVFTIIAFSWYTKTLQNKIKLLENQLQLSARLVQELRSELVEQEQIIKVVQSPEVRIVDLKGLEPAPMSKGKVLWNPSQNKAVFYAFDLPQAASDKDYQLWMIRGNQPIDAGILTIDAEGGAVTSIDTISDSANLTAFAVTLEPKGGVPQPTGKMFLLGTVSEG